ncbi:MAG TPA: T9SS type A sorting domain-containing protein [Bacteroidia bacterium]|nr:T9SS type A sorting domain-containing protein [Bacteroidia bacterium]
MALTNSAVIGEQGSQTSGSGNWWRWSTLLGCDPWGQGGAVNQTYCEDSDPIQSKLNVIFVTPNYNPQFNAGNANPGNYIVSTGPSTSPNIDLAPSNRLSDCTGNHIYGPPPSWRLTSSIDENLNETENHVRIYPNPCSDYFVLESLEILIGSTCRIYSVSGVELLSKTITVNYKTEIDISQLLPALYFIQLTDCSGKVSNYKLVKSE